MTTYTTAPMYEEQAIRTYTAYAKANPHKVVFLRFIGGKVLEKGGKNYVVVVREKTWPTCVCGHEANHHNGQGWCVKCSCLKYAIDPTPYFREVRDGDAS